MSKRASAPSYTIYSKSAREFLKKTNGMLSRRWRVYLCELAEFGGGDPSDYLEAALVAQYGPVPRYIVVDRNGVMRGRTMDKVSIGYGDDKPGRGGSK